MSPNQELGLDVIKRFSVVTQVQVRPRLAIWGSQYNAKTRLLQEREGDACRSNYKQ